jgi:hypothetical protein
MCHNYTVNVAYQQIGVHRDAGLEFNQKGQYRFKVQGTMSVYLRRDKRLTKKKGSVIDLIPYRVM